MVREKLKPHLGKRITVRGCLAEFKDWSHRYREIGRALICHPEMDGEVLADHVWVLGVKHWKDRTDAIGRQVEFTAVVNDYLDTMNGGRNYGLANPDDLKLLHEPPCLRTTQPEDDMAELAATQPEDDMAELAATQPEDKSAAANPLQILREAKSFIKDVGGQESAEGVAKALEAVTIPIPQLIEWVRALGA